MNEVIWLNGEIIPMSEARISPEDRGFQFADGVYEVVRLYTGRPFTLDEHLARLERSAAELKLTLPIPTPQLKAEIARLTQQSGVADGMIYLQLTRGHAPRNHRFPVIQGHTLLFYARPLDPLPTVVRRDAAAFASEGSIPGQRLPRLKPRPSQTVLAPNRFPRKMADARELLRLPRRGASVPPGEGDPPGAVP